MGQQDRDAPTQRARGGRFRPRLGSTPMRTSACGGPIRKGPFSKESCPKWLLFSHYLSIRLANHGLVWLALRRTWEGLVRARLIGGLSFSHKPRALRFEEPAATKAGGYQVVPALMTSSILLASTAAQPELTEGISSDPLASECKLQGTSMSSTGLNNLKFLVSQVKQQTRVSCICISSTLMNWRTQ
ncbi:hypothetical protein ACSS6W_004623 [Trichoderma asperelloides]